MNEHGCIHQTITVKEVVDQSTFCIGAPETKDSWFPGYSWTIACCQFCSNHLGWKFLLVRNSRIDDGNNRQIFWGLSGSNVTTGKSSPMRLFHH